MTQKIDGLPPPARPADAPGAAAVRNSGGDRSEPVSAAAATDNMRLTGDAAELQALERELGASPPGLDAARVSEVRAALAEGSYRINPQEIATRLLALERELGQ